MRLREFVVEFLPLLRFPPFPMIDATIRCAI